MLVECVLARLLLPCPGLAWGELDIGGGGLQPSLFLPPLRTTKMLLLPVVTVTTLDVAAAPRAPSARPEYCSLLCCSCLTRLSEPCVCFLPCGFWYLSSGGRGRRGRREEG